MLFASDDDVYGMLQEEQKRIMQKNACIINRVPKEDREAVINNKIKLIENSSKNPKKGKTFEKNELVQSFKKIGSYYKKKGYNLNNLMRYLQRDPSLSETEQCTITKEYIEAFLALPKTECAALMRTLIKMDIGEE